MTSSIAISTAAACFVIPMSFVIRNTSLIKSDFHSAGCRPLLCMIKTVRKAAAVCRKTAVHFSDSLFPSTFSFLSLACNQYFILWQSFLQLKEFLP